MAQVLQAVLEHSPVIQPHIAVTLGASLVSEIEVLHAMRTSKPKSAAGVDGIELKLYRKFSDFFVPLFQRMFSVIGTTCVFLDYFRLNNTCPPAAHVTLRGPLAPIFLLHITHMLF